MAGPEHEDMNIFEVILNGRVLFIKLPEHLAALLRAFDWQGGKGDHIRQRRPVGPQSMETPAHICNARLYGIPDIWCFCQCLGVVDIYFYFAFRSLLYFLNP